MLCYTPRSVIFILHFQFDDSENGAAPVPKRIVRYSYEVLLLLAVNVVWMMVWSDSEDLNDP